MARADRSRGRVGRVAGAATRDEFCEPYVPPFAADVLPPDAANKLKAELHRYNERVDLPTIKPMAQARIRLDGLSYELPVLGCRQDLAAGGPGLTVGTFDDGARAGVIAEVGKGRVMLLGFCPMLAYGQLASFKPTTLEEHWPYWPRRLVKKPLTVASVRQRVECILWPVEATLLSGRKGSVLVLVNYLYKPQDSITVDLEVSHPVSKAVSTEGGRVELEKIPAGVRPRLPLKWTDLVVLEP